MKGDAGALGKALADDFAYDLVDVARRERYLGRDHVIAELSEELLQALDPIIHAADEAAHLLHLIASRQRIDQESQLVQVALEGESSVADHVRRAGGELAPG